MKNIYIVGAPRTGKSTLAKLIKEKYPLYNEISFEAVRNGFIKSFPELDMGNRKSNARKEKFPEFLFEFLYWNNVITKYPFIIEGDFASVDVICKNMKENDLIICLGHGKRTIEEIYDNVKKYSKEEDYTYNWTYEKFSKHFYNICEEDINNYNYALENSIKYYDTFNNRSDTLNQIIKNIS